MLVQTRDGAWRLIRQHDHGLLSGELAAKWCGLRGESLSAAAILAAALHDLAWIETDRHPRWDSTSQTPMTFEATPYDERLEFYARGLDEVERIDAYAGLLGSLHYARFVDPGEYPEFVRHEEGRQQRIQSTLGLSESDPTVERDRMLVRLFDNLSLWICLGAPGSLAPPSWLDPVAIGHTPEEEPLALRWTDDVCLSVDPFPFREEFEVVAPCRDVSKSVNSQAELSRAWESAAVGSHRVTVRHAPSTAPA